MKTKTTKRALIVSVLSLLMCASMLVGTTFAWFTDSVTSGANKIVAGNLDIELNVWDKEEKTFVDATKVNTVFGVDLWEPGVVAYETFEASNVGNLALKYDMLVEVIKMNATEDGNNLSEVIRFAVIDAVEEDATREEVLAAVGDTWQDFTEDGVKAAAGTLLPGDSEVFTVVAYWQPNVKDDNLYNLNNGKTSDDDEPLYIDFGVVLTATQVPYEKDSFNEHYDAEAAGGIYAVTAAIVKGAADSNAALEDGVYFDTELTNEEGVLATTLHFSGKTQYILDAFDVISNLIVTAVNENAANIKSIEIGHGLPEKLAAMGVENVETNVRELNGEEIEDENWLYDDLSELMKAAGLNGLNLFEAMEACLAYFAEEGLDVAITDMDGNMQVYRMYFDLGSDIDFVTEAVAKGQKDANDMLNQATEGTVYFGDRQDEGDVIAYTLYVTDTEKADLGDIVSAVTALIEEAVTSNSDKIASITVGYGVSGATANTEFEANWLWNALFALAFQNEDPDVTLASLFTDGVNVKIDGKDGTSQIYKMNFDLPQELLDFLQNF